MESYLPRDLDAEALRRYPEIIDAGEIGLRFLRATQSPISVLGDELWLRYAEPILPVLVELMDDEVQGFGRRAVASVTSLTGRLPPQDDRVIEIMELVSVFGLDSPRGLAADLCQFGYACALARLYLTWKALPPPRPAAEVLSAARELDGRGAELLASRTLVNRYRKAWFGPVFC